ncbi:hypothetical protein B296_00001226 [Ensete ventricosum]|uniref:Uncharacterized protein n=1 Tax=Ensete ventricosum TaxID=4639 RepID=A0A427AB07_ENSVE|nr:hypothetical protein B296_00001226 [Ensete ventricosum]
MPLLLLRRWRPSPFQPQRVAGGVLRGSKDLGPTLCWCPRRCPSFLHLSSASTSLAALSLNPASTTCASPVLRDNFLAAPVTLDPPLQPTHAIIHYLVIGSPHACVTLNKRSMIETIEPTSSPSPSVFLPPNSVSVVTSGWYYNFHGKDVIVFQRHFHGPDPVVLPTSTKSHYSDLQSGISNDLMCPRLSLLEKRLLG